jgi:hypothetical protein
VKYILPLIILLTACSESPPPTKEEILIKKLIKRTKRVVTKLTKNPDSVKFRNLKIYDHFHADRDLRLRLGLPPAPFEQAYVCGEISEKGEEYNKFYYLNSPDGPSLEGIILNKFDEHDEEGDFFDDSELSHEFVLNKYHKEHYDEYCVLNHAGGEGGVVINVEP